LAFHERELTEKLSTLTNDGRLAFGLLCCERMFPNYVAFSKHNAWGDPAVLRAALDACWDKLDGGSVSSDLGELKTQCEACAPDTEDFHTILASSALDASAATTILIDLVMTRDVQQAVSIASLSRDIVDMFVQELENMPPNATDLEQMIQRHALMQRELRAQQEDLERVSGSFDKVALRHVFRDKRSGSTAVE
jgi:uncharacterized protein YjaG (DUF416 family)